MWNKTETEESERQIQPPPVVPEHIAPVPPSIKAQATIGKTIHIKGDLTGEEDLFIEGSVDGKIQLRQHNVTVGKNGHVSADICGNKITIEGNVEGNLFGEDQLILKKSSKVRGNIIAPRVVLEDGSNFKGSIDMSPKEKGEKFADIPGPLPERQFETEAVNTGSAMPEMSIAEV